MVGSSVCLPGIDRQLSRVLDQGYRQTADAQAINLLR
jgi:hypothetical protein